jgi:hypothetical protein
MTVTFVDGDGALWDAWVVDSAPSPALCFSSANETRRLADCPANWSALPAPALGRLCRRARVVKRITPARMADGVTGLAGAREERLSRPLWARPARPSALAARPNSERRPTGA